MGVKTTPTFEKELEHLINKNSLENESGTPDFILAQFLINCLNTYNLAVMRREAWCGRAPSPAPPEGAYFTITRVSDARFREERVIHSVGELLEMTKEFECGILVTPYNGLIIVDGRLDD